MGFKGCLASFSGNRPKSPVSCLFRPFPKGPKSTWEIQKTEEERPFSSDFLIYQKHALCHPDKVTFGVPSKVTQKFDSKVTFAPLVGCMPQGSYGNTALVDISAPKKIFGDPPPPPKKFSNLSQTPSRPLAWPLPSWKVPLPPSWDFQ